jgi:DNA polymerase-3 subunit gamma/tau
MENNHGVLHIKYRPKTLGEVVGNRALVRSLEALLERESGDRPRSYLLHGPSGCGKTTIARILAAELGARGMDFTEIDVADYRGIDTVRKLRERIQLMPMEGDTKAYILDECHQLSKDAQSALLKSLEDTPPHVCFFLCTTDPQKLLPTVRNRCQQLAVESLDEEDIDRLLKNVVTAEKKSSSQKSREKIISLCKGSPRAALTMLDAVIDLPRREQAGAVRAVEDMEKQAIDLCRAIAKKRPWPEIVKIIATLRKTTEAEEVRRAIMGYFTSVMLGDGSSDKSAYLFLDAFREPTYNNGWAEIVMSAWELVQGGDIEPF